MPIIDLINRNRACQYIGSNGADILALYQEIVPATALTYSIQSDTGTSITVVGKQGSNVIITMTTNLNNYAVISDGNLFTADFSLTDLERFFLTYGSTASIMSQQAAFINAVQSSMSSNAGAFGSFANVVVPGLSSANFTVNIAPAFPNTFLNTAVTPNVWTYKACPVLTGSASLLGSLSITNVNATTKLLNDTEKLSATQVRVTVQNSGALQLSGAAILVHCTP